MQIREAEVGVRLVHRTSRRVELTAAGEAFLVEVEQILEHPARAVEVAGGRHPAHCVAAEQHGWVGLCHTSARSTVSVLRGLLPRRCGASTSRVVHAPSGTAQA